MRGEGKGKVSTEFPLSDDGNWMRQTFLLSAFKAIMKTHCIAIVFGLMVAFLQDASGFIPHAKLSTKQSSLDMVPKYNPKEQKWSPASEEESDSASYPVVQSLLRHGPKAFFVRVTQPGMYDQAVLKFMAGENVGRWEAQGNMDRFNENAQDWIFERMEAKKKGYKLDYVTLNPKQVVLSSVWAGIVFWFANDCFQKFVLK